MPPAASCLKGKGNTMKPAKTPLFPAGRANRPAAVNLGAAVALTVLCLVTVLPAGTVAAETITWHAYGKGMDLGKDQNKKVLINFYADWCGYCRKMDKETYRDRAVVDYMKDHFIAIKVNSDREGDTASKYRVQGLPSTWFITESGEKISNLPGFVPPDLFIRILEYIQTDSYEKMSFKKFLKQS